MTTHRHPPRPSDDLEGADELSSSAFRAFHRALRLHHRVLMRVCARHGVHHGQAMCLRLLASGRNVAQRDLTRMLHVSPPTAAKMLASMERSGLVRRRPDATDARLVRVELTAAGQAQERAMRAAAGDYAQRTFGSLPRAERAELARLLAKLGDSIERIADEDEEAAR
jgi:DNA-binding MarR family transcriptional regulator